MEPTPEDLKYWYAAEITRVVDGDTIDCKINMGLRIYREERLRLAGINAPEPRGSTKIAGDKSATFLVRLLKKYNNKVLIKTSKADSFGRWIAYLYIYDKGKFINLNDEMVDSGHAEYKTY